MPPLPTLPHSDPPRDTWHEKLAFGLGCAVLGGICGYSLAKYEDSRDAKGPSASATATDTLTMPKVTKTDTDWEK